MRRFFLGIIVLGGALLLLPAQAPAQGCPECEEYSLDIPDPKGGKAPPAGGGSGSNGGGGGGADTGSGTARQDTGGDSGGGSTGETTSPTTTTPSTGTGFGSETGGPSNPDPESSNDDGGGSERQGTERDKQAADEKADRPPKPALRAAAAALAAGSAEAEPELPAAASEPLEYEQADVGGALGGRLGEVAVLLMLLSLAGIALAVVRARRGSRTG